MSNTSMAFDEFKLIWSELAQGELLLDVRTPEEFANAKIPGSKNIPHDQVLSHLEELTPYKKIFIYCKMGGRAQTAYHMLEGAGLNNLVCIADAGMHAWCEQGLKTE